MTSVLRIYIDENWPENPSAPWVLLDKRGKCQNEGVSDPRHWPAATHCEVILSAPQCAYLRTTIPQNTRKTNRDRLIRYALEEQLLRDIDEQHLTLINTERREQQLAVDVIVCARQRLRQIVAQFKALKQPLAYIGSELHNRATPHNSSPCLSIGPTGQCVLSIPSQPPLAVELDHLSLLLPTSEQTVKTTAVLSLDPRWQTTEGQSLFLNAGIEASEQLNYHWWQDFYTTTNLLHTEFNSHQNGHSLYTTFKPLIWLCGLATIWFLFVFGQVIWQRHTLNHLEKRMQRVFSTALPNTPAVAPATQLQRSLDLARSQAGELSQQDFLSLLNSYIDIGGAIAQHSVVQLNYQDQRLQLTLRTLNPDEQNLIKHRLEAMGYTVLSDPTSSATLTMMRKMTP